MTKFSKQVALIVFRRTQFDFLTVAPPGEECSRDENYALVLKTVTESFVALTVFLGFAPSYSVSKEMANDMHQLMCLFSCLTCVLARTAEDIRAQEYLAGYNSRAEYNDTIATEAAWDFSTNITEYNKQKMTGARLVWSEFVKMEAKKAAEIDQALMSDNRLKRQLNLIMDVGIDGYNDTSVLRQISEVIADMESIYSSAKWCKSPSECNALYPGLIGIFTSSKDYKELRDTWKGWRDVSGAKSREKFEEYVSLINTAITAEGKYSDMGEYWRSWYEQPTFEEDVRSLFDQLSPLYDQLHAYVRRKLRQHYGAEHFPESGHIPAHLLGNMWAQDWSNIYDIVEPYPDQGRPSLTDVMKAKNYTVRQMFDVAEELFTSIGMNPMPESFWRLSMLEKPEDGRDVDCHASAWDFVNGTDFRIKMCTEVTEQDMRTVHHEMGHVEYYLEYINQPYRFRTGANPGFHEGVADIVKLSFETPEHLKEIGLLDKLPSGQESDINFLLQMALSDVAFLPFGYLVDQWRWSVFRGETTPANYNTKWWDLRCQYQGIVPPVERSEDDFDPGAKNHIISNAPYIRYFVSSVAMFQWHKALCEMIGQHKTLNRCDIYRNKAAGARLKEMLKMGKSRPWGEAMRTITRDTSGETDKLDAGALLGYFEPLRVWLEQKNKADGEDIGWNKTHCPPGTMRQHSGAPSMSLTSLLLSPLSLLQYRLLKYCRLL